MLNAYPDSTIEENTHKRGEVQLQIEDIKPIE